jgi:hypothetical protein
MRRGVDIDACVPTVSLTRRRHRQLDHHGGAMISRRLTSPRPTGKPPASGV